MGVGLSLGLGHCLPLCGLRVYVSHMYSVVYVIGPGPTVAECSLGFPGRPPPSPLEFFPAMAIGKNAECYPALHRRAAARHVAPKALPETGRDGAALPTGTDLSTTTAVHSRRRASQDTMGKEALPDTGGE